MNIRIALLAALAAPLAACAPAPVAAPVPAVAPVPGVAPVPVVAPVQGVAGLQERQPDLCKAKNYVPALGQPASVIPTLGITKPVRVVEYRGIEPEEYVADRVVFRLDASGKIYNIDCG